MRIGVWRPGLDKPGGTETFIQNIVKELSHHEFLIVTDSSDLYKYRNVEIYNAPSLNRVNVLGTDLFEIESITNFLTSKFSGVLREVDEQVDVWSTHFWLENLLLSRQVNTPNLFRFPGIQNFWYHYWAMAKLGRPDIYLANSQFTKQRAKTKLDIDCRDTVYAGVDTDRFSPDAEPVYAETGGVNFVYAGRLSNGKGLKTLIEAFNRLRGNTKLWLIGTGSLENALKKKVNTLTISDEVEFVGQVPHNQIPAWLVASDVFVLPSTFEAFPVSSLEAMATGLPTVLSDIPATREQAGGEGAALFFQHGDVNDLTEKLQYLVDRPSERERMGRNARKVAESYSWSEATSKMDKYYKECVEVR